MSENAYHFRRDDSPASKTFYRLELQNKLKTMSNFLKLHLR